MPFLSLLDQFHDKPHSNNLSPFVHAPPYPGHHSSTIDHIFFALKKTLHTFIIPFSNIFFPHYFWLRVVEVPRVTDLVLWVWILNLQLSMCCRVKSYTSWFPFLVACSRLYTPLCRSVGRSVGRLVGLSPFYFFYSFYSYQVILSQLSDFESN